MHRPTKRRAATGARAAHLALMAILALPSCEEEPAPQGGSGAEGGAASTSGGAGAGGDGGAPACAPGETRACYAGPADTADVGQCRTGTQACVAEGTGFGACEGEVLPSIETCETPDDEDCDGLTNEEGAGCVCEPGATVGCYTGPDGTLGVGLCAEGSATCNADGTALGACTDEVLPAFDSCASAADEDCDDEVLACSGDHVWSYRFGGANDQVGAGVAVHADGRVVVVANGQGSIDFGGGTLTGAGMGDVFAASFDAAGAHMWSKRFGDGAAQEVAGIAAADAGAVLIAGDFAGAMDVGGGVLTSAGSRDVFVVQLDAAGDHVWSKRFGDASAQRTVGLASDAMGGVVITGYYGGAVDFGGGPLQSQGGLDGFVVRFDPAGNHLWSKQFGDTALIQQGMDAEIDADGNVLVVGRFEGTVDFGGSPLTSAAGGTDVFVAKFDPAGAHLWSERFGAGGSDVATNVTTAPDGTIVITGAFEGSIDFGGGMLTGAAEVYLAAFDPAGVHLWSKSFGEGLGLGVAAEVAGALVLTGNIRSTADFGGGPLTSAGDADAFVAKFDGTGAHLWSKRFGSAGAQQGSGVALDAQGHTLVTGYVFGTLDAGGGPLVSVGGSDLFVAKLSP